MPQVNVPAYFVFGIEGSLPHDVGVTLAEKYKLTFIDIDEILESTYGKSPAEIVISSGDQALRDALLSIWRWIIFQEGEALPTPFDAERNINAENAVVVLPGALLDDELVVEQMNELHKEGTQLIRTTAALQTITKRLGFNRPRSVALGPTRMILATKIREREEYWDRVFVDEVTIDTSVDIPEL